MRSYKEIAEMTGTTVDEVRTMMRAASKKWDPMWNATCDGCDLALVWRVGNAATGCIGSGCTREEAVIYALEHNSQYAKVL